GLLQLLVHLTQLGGLLVDLRKQLGIFRRNADLMSNRLDELQLIGREAPWRARRQMEHADRFVAGLDGKSCCAAKAKRGYFVFSADLLVLPIVEVVKHERLSRLEYSTADACRQLASIHGASGLFTQTLLCQKTKLGFSGVQHVDPTGVEVERLDHFLQGFF